MNETLEKASDAPALRVEDFEFDLYILGLMAANYSRWSGICPVRGGMDSVENRQVYDPQTKLWYACSKDKSAKTGKVGLRLSARESPSSPEVLRRFFPWESFRRVKVAMECEEL